MIQIAQQKTAAQAAKFFAFIAAIAVLVFALTACSFGGDKTERTFTKSEQGVEMTMTYYATGDLVTKQTSKNVLDYSLVGVENKADAQAKLDPLFKEFKDVKGVDHHVEYGDTSLTETLTVDYEKADIAEVAKLPGSNFQGGSGANAKVTLKDSLKILEQGGFTEVK